MSAKNKEIVQKVDAAFAENSLEGFLSFCADDIEFTMVGDQTVNGKDAIRQWMSSMDMEPPKIRNEKMVAEGESVTAYGTMTMKNREGKTVPYAYCDIYQFRSGKIAKLTAFVVSTAGKPETAGAA